MFCVPACKGCREAGSCPKGELPASRPSAPRRYRPDTVVSMGKLKLKCGHDVDKFGMLVLGLSPRGKVWCEQCGRYEPQQAKKKRNKITKDVVDELPF